MAWAERELIVFGEYGVVMRLTGLEWPEGGLIARVIVFGECCIVMFQIGLVLKNWQYSNYLSSVLLELSPEAKNSGA